MPEKLNERESNLIGLAAAAHYLATGVPRMDGNGNISRERILSIAIPPVPGFIRYVQKNLQIWKDITQESLDYSAAVRGWTTLIQDIMSRMEKGHDASILLTSELYLLLIAIAAQKLSILTEAQQTLNLPIFDEVVDSLPSEAGDDEEIAEEAAA